MGHPPDDDWDVVDDHGRYDDEQHHEDHNADGFEDDLLGEGAYHDDSLADDVLDPAPVREQFRPRRRRRRSPVGKVVALLVAGVVVVGVAVWGISSIGSLLPSISIGGQDAPTDYEGSGTGEVMVEIPAGAVGEQMGQILVEADVVASTGAFVAAFQADPRSGSIQPGTYRMATQMSAQAALARMLDGNYREISGITIREGLWVQEVFELLAEGTGHEVADYEAVDPEDLDLPDAAEGELEGFLFPSTYEFGPDATPQQQLQAMVDLFNRKQTEIGITDEELRDVIIKASLVQAEGALPDDLPKVARVIENRMAADDLLRFDSTVHFIFQERGLAGTTDAQRASDDPHNTYRFAGLPPGPINSPGEAAIRAAMNPTPGDWYYFATVNPHTGETNFAETWEEHEENVQLFMEWCQENEDQC